MEVRWHSTNIQYAAGNWAENVSPVCGHLYNSWGASRSRLMTVSRIVTSNLPEYHLLGQVTSKFLSLGNLTAITMTSHAEFGERTPGSEIAKVFADQIRGKTSASILPASERLLEFLASLTSRCSMI